MKTRKNCDFALYPIGSPEGEVKIKEFVWEVPLGYQILINRKFRVATKIESTFFGCSSVDKKRNY
jgi:hypothetical protein